VLCRQYSRRPTEGSKAANVATHSTAQLRTAAAQLGPQAVASACVMELTAIPTSSWSPNNRTVDGCRQARARRLPVTQVSAPTTTDARAVREIVGPIHEACARIPAAGRRAELRSMSGQRYDAAWRRGSFQSGLTKWHV